jgi:hypothetical protein
LVLKKVCTEDEWNEFKEDVWYDFKQDNNFSELKEAELLTNRLTLLQVVDPYVGRYYSKEWVRKNVLHQTDEDIMEIEEQIAKEAEEAQPAVDQMGNQIDPATGQPIQPQVDAQGQPIMGQPEEQAPPPKFSVGSSDMEAA